jgi:hypothetical protein
VGHSTSFKVSAVTFHIRLKHTWNGVREQEDMNYNRLTQEYSRENNYSALRALHSSAPPPIVPFLGMCVPPACVCCFLTICSGISATSRSSMKAIPTQYRFKRVAVARVDEPAPTIYRV